jgi:cephalosporin hydroxylase
MGISLEALAKKSEASQGSRELGWLLGKVQDVDPKVIIEIGVHLGHSLKVWQDAFMPEILIGIDNESNDTLEDYLNTGKLQASIARFDSHDPGCVKMIEFLLGGRKIDFLFIDGDHTYEGVKQDYETFKPLVKNGGIIALHDAALKDNPTVEVYKLWDELKGNKVLYQKDGTGVGVIHV